MSSAALQGTKVLEDREIRLIRTITAVGIPPDHVPENITKYTGALVPPEWKDVEPGRVLFPLIPCEKCSEPKDKFETLCHVKANISSAPYTSKLGEMGEMGYMRQYSVILLVGLTELQAQVSWIDAETVCDILFNLHTPHLI